jgi:hypothetical protein
MMRNVRLSKKLTFCNGKNLVPKTGHIKDNVTMYTYPSVQIKYYKNIYVLPKVPLPEMMQSPFRKTYTVTK